MNEAELSTAKTTALTLAEENGAVKKKLEGALSKLARALREGEGAVEELERARLRAARAEAERDEAAER